MLSDRLWGERSQLSYLLIAAFLLLVGFLGSHEIWTQEHRWADIVSGMFYRHDFFHPYLNDVMYYDKPLLSYWFIAFFSLITGELSTWALRLPSAFAGLLAVWSIYQIGTHLKDKRLGLLAGWMLLTTYFFIFWARTSSADMLNLGGILFAVAWYFTKKNQASFWNYTIFFIIIAVTSLCKGLVGAVVTVLAILPDLWRNKEWKKHLRPSFFLAMIPAAMIYFLPFWVSTQVGGDGYQQSGLYLVYRENMMRYFQPFDHKGPFYTYFIFLPVYLLPWTVFFIPALFSLPSRWKKMPPSSQWMVWSTLLLFLFFTFSGSRRSYYVLPMVPFAILMTADWVVVNAALFKKRYLWAGRVAGTFFILFILHFLILQPLYYAKGGIPVFAERLREEAIQIRPWSEWQFVMLDPESKVRFYLHLAPTIKNYSLNGQRQEQTTQSLLEAWPFLKNTNPYTIYITRKQYQPLLESCFKGYRVIEAPPSLGKRWFHSDEKDAPIAFVPLKKE